MPVDTNPAATREHTVRHNAISTSPFVEELADGCLVATHRLYVDRGAAAVAAFLAGVGYTRLAAVAHGGDHVRDFSVLNQIGFDLFQAPLDNVATPIPPESRARSVLDEIAQRFGTGLASLVPYVTLAPHDMGPSGPPALWDELLGGRRPAQAGAIAIAVLDTGLPAAAAGGAGGNGLDVMHPIGPVVASIRRDDPEADPLYAAPNDLDEPTAPGHGLFVATVAARRTPENVQIRSFRSSGHIVSTAVAIPPFPIGTLLSTAEIAVDLLALGVDVTIPDKLIVNMSFGGYFTNAVDIDVLKLAMIALLDKKREMVFCAAAGNKADPNCCNDGTEPIYPAAYSMTPELCRNVVSVGALTESAIDLVPPFVAEFSGRGPWVTAWALGVDVKSEFVPGEWTNGTNVITFPATNPKAKWSGTSFATPIVAAAIARQCLQGDFTPQEAWNALRTSEDRIVWDLDGRRHWHGAVLD